MYKKLSIILILLCIPMFLFNGCAREQNYSNKEVTSFKKYIISNYNDIKSITVSNLAIDFTIAYELKKDISDEEREKVFEKTREYLKNDSFIKSINKEAKRDTFFKRIDVEFKNPSTSYHFIYSVKENSELKAWIISDFKNKAVERTYDDK